MYQNQFPWFIPYLIRYNNLSSDKLILFIKCYILLYEISQLFSVVCSFIFFRHPKIWINLQREKYKEYYHLNNVQTETKYFKIECRRYSFYVENKWVNQDRSILSDILSIYMGFPITEICRQFKERSHITKYSKIFPLGNFSSLFSLQWVTHLHRNSIV